MSKKFLAIEKKIKKIKIHIKNKQMGDKNLYQIVLICNKCLILTLKNFKKKKRKIFLNIKILRLKIDFFYLLII